MDIALFLVFLVVCQAKATGITLHEPIREITITQAYEGKAPLLSLTQSVLLFSAQLDNGETYVIYTGGSSTGTVTDGLYADGGYTAGTEAASLTVSGVVTSGGAQRGGPGGGGPPPGGQP